MSVTLTWGIQTMECYVSLIGNENIVSTVGWTLEAVNDETGAHAKTQGLQKLTINEGASFIPYNELTQEKVIEWVLSELGDDLANQYISDVTNIVDPIMIKLPLPWLPTVEVVEPIVIENTEIVASLSTAAVAK